MSRLTRDGMAEPFSRGQNLRCDWGQEKKHFPCSADHEQYWQSCPVDPYSAISDDHAYIYAYCSKIHIYIYISSFFMCVVVVDA